VATIQELGKRLETAGELLGVVKTMKSLAAVNIRTYETAARALDSYDEVVQTGFKMFFSRQGELREHQGRRHVLVLALGSDQGMCGQFNEAVLETVEERHQAMKARELSVDFWTVGERVYHGVRDMGLGPRRHFDLPGSLEAVTPLVQDLIRSLDQARSEQGVESFHVFHNRLGQGRSSYAMSTRRLLPLDREWLERIRKDPDTGRQIPMLGLPREELFFHLFEEYLTVGLFRALAQSLASENAARLSSMQAAEKNIQEMQEELQADFREARQKQITEELFDVVAGFEAVTGR
jgi:F-type H+-transporting ATPase subunit gamma